MPVLRSTFYDKDLSVVSRHEANPVYRSLQNSYIGEYSFRLLRLDLCLETGFLHLQGSVG